MDIQRAKTAGFCMGVSLALHKLDRELDITEQAINQPHIATYGPIIHNPQVLEDYAARGVLCLNSTDDVTGQHRIIIRAHGIPHEVENDIRNRGAQVIDATCPKVKKAQLGIDEQRRAGRTLLLFGEAEHPEVLGLLSYAGHEAIVFGSEEELAAIPLSHALNYFLAAQTTQDRAAFERIKMQLQERLGHAVPVLETICDATRLRQDEAINIAQHVDAMLVVGGFNSGNTRRLADVAAAQGPFTVHVENIQQLSPEHIAILQQSQSIGLTAGASTPKHIIDIAEDFLLKL